jgi:hypothetical protein
MVHLSFDLPSLTSNKVRGRGEPLILESVSWPANPHTHRSRVDSLTSRTVKFLISLETNLTYLTLPTRHLQ